MLNEIKEYESYLSGDLQSIPLQKAMLRNNMSGIRRPLQVLARGFLEKCIKLGTPLKEAIPMCKAFLHTWICGQMPENVPFLPPELMDELERAGLSSFLWYANTVSNADYTQECNQMAKDYARVPYSGKALPKRNTFNEIYFDTVIADSLYLGPLQNRCLLLKSSQKGYGLNGNDKERKIALAVVSQYLQLKSRIGNEPHREFVPIVQGEIGNWVNVRAKTGSGASVSGTLTSIKLSGTEELLFEKIPMDNTTRLRVSPQWLSENDVKLLNAEAAPKQLQPGYLLITDKELLVAKRKSF